MKEPTDKITRWALLLQTYDYDVKYRRGKQNGSPDALSRLTYNSELSNDDNLFLGAITNDLNDTSKKEEVFNENIANDE